MIIFNDESIEGCFIKRLNRFLGLVLIKDKEELVHIPNTGRMLELLTLDAKVLLEKSNSRNRKTKYTLKLVLYKKIWVCIDSLITNKIAYEYLEEHKKGIINREVKYLNSRFDFTITTPSEKTYIEVKSVNLVKDGIAFFPDAPTARGTKHILELKKCIQEGYRALVIFIVQRNDAYSFKPNVEVDKSFVMTLRDAYNNGLEVLVLKCRINNKEISIEQKIDFIIAP